MRKTKVKPIEVDEKEYVAVQIAIMVKIAEEEPAFSGEASAMVREWAAGLLKTMDRAWVLAELDKWN